MLPENMAKDNAITRQLVSSIVWYTTYRTLSTISV